MGHLNQLHEKYFVRGLRVIGLSDDAESEIRSLFVDELGAKYWIAVDAGSRLLRSFGGGGIPHVYLIDPDGRVIGDMHPSDLPEERIEELLMEAFVPPLDRELHPKLKRFVGAYEKGEMGKAWTGAGRLLQDEDETLAADAKFLREKCAAYAEFQRKLVERKVAEKAYDEALDALDRIRKDYSGMQLGRDAIEMKRKLDRDPDVDRERKAWRFYLKVLETEREAEGNARELAGVRELYARVLEKYPDTRAAESARSRMRALPQ